MNSIIGEYIDNFMLVYLVDILMFSNTGHEHENHLRLVFFRVDILLNIFLIVQYL